ncbi:MAG: pantoate--beta-alanine ligase [Rhodospirillaceae bacterium]|nr:pantoate--beta-alanine ligase [Rhodospirillaceae bacterium]
MIQNFTTVRTVSELRQVIGEWRRAGLSVGLVPTMGALHEGHFSLVDRSVMENDRTCVSLFVNPKQFSPTEDFDLYPRNEAADAQALQCRGANVLFAPLVEEMYPADAATSVSVPGLGDVLEGEFRDGFFTGVATVVSKLLIQSMADRAYFGDKDYQQLRVIRRLTADLNIPVQIIGCPIIREEDGLALSSRNAYLTTEERAIAPALYTVLLKMVAAIQSGADSASAVQDGTQHLLSVGFMKVDYLAVVDPETLLPLSSATGPCRVLGAAWLGKTRLIDNVGV